jgi:hypothetical protein
MAAAFERAEQLGKPLAERLLDTRAGIPSIHERLPPRRRVSTPGFSEDRPGARSRYP